MCWIFPIPGYKAGNIRPSVVDAVKSIELSNFMDDYYWFNEKGTKKSINTMTKEDETKYFAAWSQGVFSKDYNFSKKDILIILEWSWNNRAVFYDLWPYPLSFTRYYDDDKAFENWRHKIQPILLKYKSNDTEQ
jgi:hypothetical protein